MVAVCRGLTEGEKPTREGSIAAGLPKMGSTQGPDGDLVTWFREGINKMVDTFENTPPTKPVYAFGFGPQEWQFVARRMAHETAMHRWDAEHAVGTAAGFDKALAADGIDELLGVMVPMFFKHADFAGSGQTIHLHETGGDTGWSIKAKADNIEWRHEHNESADVTAIGSLNDLYLFMWNRLPADELDVLGDEQLLTRWLTAAAV